MGCTTRAAIGLAVVSVVSCSSAPESIPGEAIFAIPASLDELSGERFYDHPFPSDIRRDEGGAIHLAGFYNPHRTILIEAYIDAMKGRIAGFSPTAMGYLRFTTHLDPGTLPGSPEETRDAGASVQIVDVDPASPERGQRHLASVYWQKDEAIYWRKDTLAVGPALGYPLRSRTRYAIVVTKKVRAVGGAAITPSVDLEEVLGQKPPTPRTEAVRRVYAPAVADLEAAGVHAADIAHLAVFTTDDPTAELFAVADDVHAKVPAPAANAAAWIAKEQTATYDVYEGTYGPSPNYQEGKVPYERPEDGGDFVFDAAGKPVLQGTFDMRFSLVVPKAPACPPPASGYPMVLYGHGTGGDFRSIVDERGSVGAALAKKCVASMGVDQIFHGARPGAPPASDTNREGNIELLFFNFNNPHAMRTNNRQSAIDVVQQARLFTDAHLTIPASTSRTRAAIAFDASNLVFFGHSQGGLNGPLFLAADGQTRGGVLSGSSSSVPITLLEKTKPTPSVASAVRTLLQLTRDEDAAELGLAHPVFSFAQTIVDPMDPLNYVGYFVRHPRAGLAPKSILQTEGVGPDGTGDSYAPPHGIEIGAVASGLPRMTPGTHAVVEMKAGGLTDVSIPPGGLQGNLAGGAASGVLAQFLPPKSDGHYVVFDVPAAREMAAQFCRNLADDPRGRVPAIE